VPNSNEYMAAYMLRRYHERRAEAVAALGGKCVRCGSIEDLQLDHRDPADKSFNIGKLWSVSRVRYLAELAKCQLLCAECHTNKTLADRGQRPARGTHGTLSSYRYCKCRRCRAAKSKYERERRAAKVAA
jgi:5-methylcytosine-specific restriction endonuclease McrA